MRAPVIVSLFCLGCVPFFVWNCNSSSSSDGGSDVAEEVLEICNDFSGAGMSCPRASTVICFPVCDAGGGCQCKGDPPKWDCFTPPECINPCGNSSPLNDASCPDAEDGSEPEQDASDASETDVVEEATTDSAVDSAADAVSDVATDVTTD